MVVAEEEDTEAETGRQDHPDAGVAFGHLPPQRPDESRHHERPDQGPDERVVGHEESSHGAGEGQFAGAVHGKGHGSGDDERADQAATGRHQERRFEGMLGKTELEVVADAH